MEGCVRGVYAGHKEASQVHAACSSRQKGFQASQRVYESRGRAVTLFYAPPTCLPAMQESCVCPEAPACPYPQPVKYPCVIPVPVCPAPPPPTAPTTTAATAAADATATTGTAGVMTGTAGAIPYTGGGGK